MLIPLHELGPLYITGVLHVGAHECEEREAYLAAGVTEANIYWVEAQEHLVAKMRQRLPGRHILQAVVSDKDNDAVCFIVTNNMQSSSILELEEHKVEHPNIVEVGRYATLTTRLDTLWEREKLPPTLNFLNIDIQGAELLALKGLGSYLDQFRYIYLEVNTKHLYKDCALLPEIDSFLEGHGFQRAAIRMTDNGWGDAFYVAASKNG